MEKNFSADAKTVKRAPEPTLRRLAAYHQYLGKMKRLGEESISSSMIAKEMDMVPVVVRKDIEMTGIVGRPKVGYEINELISAIEDFLGWNNTRDAFLVGAGNLGLALLGYEGFLNYGLNIVAAFDNDKQKIGTTIHGKTILGIDKLADMIKQKQVKIGIITVPSAYAQKTADIMVEAGIEAIWNFAPLFLNIPENIIVQNENLASSLAILSTKISKRRQEKI